MIYFHGNGEDLGNLYDLAENIHRNCSISVLAVEYPKYGMYKSDIISEDRICQDASTVFEYVKNTLK